VELFIGLFILWILMGDSGRSRFWNSLRGAPDLKSTDEANAVSDQRMRLLRSLGQMGNALVVYFGLLRVPLEVLSKTSLILGVQGCGKSSLIKAMLKSIVALFHVRTGRTRIVVLDIKNEFPRWLHGLIPKHIFTHLLNPFDLRASILNCPFIFLTRSDIEQLAYSICPPIPGDQTPHFRNSARQTIALVIWILQLHVPKATRPWGFFEVCAILSDKKLLRRVLFCHYEGRSFYRATLGPNIKSSGDVFSTIRSVIQSMIPAALVELDNPTRLNIKEFLHDDGVIVLGIPPTGAQAVLPIFNIFIRRLIEEAQLNTNPEDRLILVFDEIAMFDRAVIEAIVNATALGRSYGIHVIAATQSIELLEFKFGVDQAQAFLASCATTVGFRCASRKTAEYFVGRMASQEGIVLLTSWTSGHNANSSTTTQHLQVRATVLPDEVLHAPLADPIADLMTFWVTCPTFGNAKVTTTFMEESSVEMDSTYPNICPRPSGANALRPLTKSDWVALGLPSVVGQT
jgi:hypothetical protein